MDESLLKKLLELTPAERIELAGDLWDSIEPEEMPPLTEKQRQEAERRYARSRSCQRIQLGGCKSATFGALQVNRAMRLEREADGSRKSGKSAPSRRRCSQIRA
jgi:putative addiction module component (TIGR02574 family)